MFGFKILILVCLLVVGFGISVHFLFRPLLKQATEKKLIGKIGLSDLLCLFFLLQVPMVVVGAGEEIRIGGWFLVGGMSLLVWLMGVKLLSCREIVGRKQRSFFLVFIFTLSVCELFRFFSVVLIKAKEFVLYGEFSWSFSYLIWTIGGMVFIVLSGCYVRWMVRTCGSEAVRESSLCGERFSEEISGKPP